MISRGERAAMERLGGALERARKEAGLSLRALASKVGLSHSSLNGIECGVYRCDDDTVSALCDALGIDAVALLTTSGYCTHCMGTGMRRDT